MNSIIKSVSSSGGEDNHIPLSRLAIASFAALALGASTTPSVQEYRRSEISIPKSSPVESPRPYQYEAPIIIIPPRPLSPVLPLRVLTEKKEIGKGPLGDKICAYKYSTNEKVSALCENKLPKEIKKYSRFIPGKYIDIPGKSEYIPGISKYIPPTTKYGYGLLPNGTYGHGTISIPGRWENKAPEYKNTPGERKYISGKIEICKTNQYYNQTDGSATIVKEDCL